MNTDNKKINKLLILLFILGLLSLVVYIPSFRNYLIYVSENIIQRSINFPDLWKERMVILENYFIHFLILLYITIITYKVNKNKNYAITKIHNFIQKTTKDDLIHYISLIIFIGFLCVIHLCISEGGDDNYFKSALNNYSFLDFLKMRYYNWSSRILIESALVKSYSFSFGLWRIINVLAFVLIAESLVYICISEKRYSFFAYFLVLFFLDYKSLHSAGWGATTANYLWPLACAMPTFMIIKDIFDKKNISIIKFLLAIFALLFAINHEQVVALILGLTVFFFISHLIKNKKIELIDFYFLGIIVLCILSIIFILKCPGNTIRFICETNNCFPGFDTLSFPHKIMLGILVIFCYYFTSNGVIVLLPLFFILTISFYKIKIRNFIIQLILNSYMLFLILMKNLTGDFLLVNNKLPQLSSHSRIGVLVECLIFIVIGILIIYQLITVMDELRKGFFNALLLCSGFCSALIIAFSPTVYESGTRVFLYMSYIVFIITLRVLFNYLNFNKSE